MWNVNGATGPQGLKGDTGFILTMWNVNGIHWRMMYKYKLFYINYVECK